MDNNLNESIWRRWNITAEKYPDKEAVIFLKDEKDSYRWTYSELILAVEKYAVFLKNNGIKPGEVCALIFKYNKEFYPVYMAVVSIGAIPAVLPYPGKRINPEKLTRGIQIMSKNSGLDWILTEKDLESQLHPIVYIEGSTIKGMSFPLEIKSSLKLSGKNLQEIIKIRSEIKSTDPAFLQYSFGTIGLQKPVLISNKALLNQITNYSSVLKITEKDKIVNWLPLNNFIGLFTAFYFPLTLGIPVVQIDPFQWLINPVLLLKVITKEKASLCWMPNFAFSLMASKIKEEDLKEISLESMRMFINCGEPASKDSIERFYIRFAEKGLKQNSISTCYAAEETTFAVTQTPPENEPEIILVDLDKFKNGKVKTTDDRTSGKFILSSGRIIKGCKIRIVNDKGLDLDEGEIGEIVINSESMFEGYRNYKEKTEEALIKGWFYSGDLGFMFKDNLFVIDRKDDLIISGGNKIYPEEIEEAASDVVGVIPSKAIAFGEYDDDFGSNQISVIAETEISEKREQDKLKARIINSVSEIGVTIKNVYFVPPKWIIKSLGFKSNRKANKKRILNGEKISWDK